MDVKVALVLALAGAVAVIGPLAMRGRHAPVDLARDESVEDEIARYRTAVRAETLCTRCGQANPAGSKYCYECGRSLPAVDAQEFDGTDA